MSSPRKRKVKKSELLEVRVTPEEKAAFVDACKSLGRSASDVIREAMRAYAQFRPWARSTWRKPVLLSASTLTAVIAAGLIFGPEISANERSHETIAYHQFQRLDVNADGTITTTELTGSFERFRSLLGTEVHRDIDLHIRRANAVTHAFGLLDVNFFEILRDPTRLSETCWNGAYERYVSRLSTRFDEWDLDHDRVVTAAEYAAARENLLREQFDAQDWNSDGALSYDDALQRAQAEQAGEIPARVPVPFETADPTFLEACQADVGRWSTEGLLASRRGELSAEDHWRGMSRFDADKNGRIEFSEYAFANAGI